MFHKEGIDTTYVGITPAEPSGVALSMSTKKGKLHCCCFRANGTLSVDDIQKCRNRHQTGIHRHYAVEPTESVTYTKMAKKDGITVIQIPPSPLLNNYLTTIANVDILFLMSQRLKSSRECILWMYNWQKKRFVILVRKVQTVIITMGAKDSRL